ncbi:MAG: AAA family ATPase [Candidatus Cryptobacteroides sp.]
MYKREIMAQLRGWAGRKKRKPLVLRGARQIGKTTLVEEFGKEFDTFISLNLEKDDAEVFRRFKTAPEVRHRLSPSTSSVRAVTLQSRYTGR